MAAIDCACPISQVAKQEPCLPVELAFAKLDKGSGAAIKRPFWRLHCIDTQPQNPVGMGRDKQLNTKDKKEICGKASANFV